MIPADLLQEFKMDSGQPYDLSVTPADFNVDMHDAVEAIRDPPESHLKEMLGLKLPALEVEAQELILALWLPSTMFLDSLSLGQKQDALCGCMLVFILSKAKPFRVASSSSLSGPTHWRGYHTVLGDGLWENSGSYSTFALASSIRVVSDCPP